ncbi:MAG: glycoside hydrolase family 3 C-terminal domain-containing protein [Clostridia bacterium]|nr:glycoside hydrolase family 3 C-terminal domain-containing protein [Clostridia bacterium]
MFKMYLSAAKEILSDMTLKEKIGQLNQITITPYTDRMEELRELIKNGGVGSIILASSATAGNDEQGHVHIALYRDLQRIAVEQSRKGIPMLYGRDVIHGHRTVYPIPLASAASFNEKLVEKCCRHIAIEALADSVRWTFSPMLDLCHDPRWGRIAEGPGEDPLLGSRMAKAFVKGFQGENLRADTSLLACAKHYLGYGASEGGKDYFRTEISDNTLYNFILPAFRAAIEAGVGTVMSSFNDINGIPVSGSKKHLTDILRDQLAFEGFVVSDWGAVEQLEHAGFAASRRECAEKAIRAGLDLDMCDRCYLENLEDLVQSGEVEQEVIDTAVSRILCVKLAMGLFENPYGKQLKYDSAEHLRDARLLAEESMVLLKNDGVLPLRQNQKIALFGPFSEDRRSLLGTWTLDGDEKKTPNFKETLNHVLESGKLAYSDDTENLETVSAESDVIILALGESYRMTGENHSVSDISLPTEQINLVKKAKATGKKVVGVFFCGRPLALQGVVENLDAVLYAWHGGSETAAAVCDILFGHTVPSGKTPVTFPRKATHIPLYYNITSSGRPANGYYGELEQGNYLDGDASPLYPFGYGLSYTEFTISDIRCKNTEISLAALQNGESFAFSVSVSNTGDFDGKETVQLYIRDKAASVIRPIRELKDYKKVFIPKGGTVEITFQIGFRDLGFYLENGDYSVEGGEFEIFIGQNCLTNRSVKIFVAP